MNYKKLFWGIILCLGFQLSQAQDADNHTEIQESTTSKTTQGITTHTTVALRSMHLIEVGEGVGYAFEFPVKEKFLLHFSATIGSGYDPHFNLAGGVGFRCNQDGCFFDFTYRLRTTGRYFYNRKKRFKKEKNLANNSGNFIGMDILHTGRNIPHNSLEYMVPTLAFNVYWGIQRYLWKGGFFNFQIGLTRAFNLEIGDARTVPHIGLRLVFVLSKR